MLEVMAAVFIKFLIKWRVFAFKALALLAALFVLAWSIYGFKQRTIESEKTVSSMLLIDEVRSIRELSALRQDYTNSVSYRSEDWVKTPVLGFKVFSSEKSFNIAYSGTVKIGYDLDKVKVEMNGKHVVVRYPHSKVLSHEINDVKVVEWDNGVWNKLDQKIFMAKLSEQNDVYIKTHLRDFDTEAAAQFKRIVSRHLSTLLRANRKSGENYRIEFVQENHGMISKVFD